MDDALEAIDNSFYIAKLDCQSAIPFPIKIKEKKIGKKNLPIFLGSLESEFLNSESSSCNRETFDFDA